MDGCFQRLEQLARQRNLVCLDPALADLDRLRSAGVEVIEEPNDQGGGFWLGTVKDPEGNLVQLTYWEPGSSRSV